MVAAILAARGVRRAVAWDHPLLADTHLAAHLARAGVELVPADTGAGAIATADAGVSAAEWGVAETGSVVLVPGVGRRRAVTLLPPIHICLLQEERLAATLADLCGTLGGLAAADDLPANVALATGPSRSGDIEGDVCLGVHGPGDTHVVLMSGYPAPDGFGH